MVDLLHVTMGTDLKDLRILCISMKKTTLFMYSKHNHIELLIHYRLLWIVLDVVTLEFDKLVEAKLAQSLPSARVLPSYPCQVLLLVSNLKLNSPENLPEQDNRIGLQRQFQLLRRPLARGLCLCLSSRYWLSSQIGYHS